MKNLIVATVALLLNAPVFVKASNGLEKTPVKSEHKSIDKKSKILGVTITLDIGRRKKNCEGIGICRVVISAELAVRGNDELPSLSYVANGNGTLTFNIPTSYLKTTQPDKWKSLNGQSQFIVEEDYTLPWDVSSKLGSHETLTVKAGSYSMINRNNWLTIVIEDVH
jgi:hypothetical protein